MASNVVNVATIIFVLLNHKCGVCVVFSLLAHFVQKDTQRDQYLDVDRKADAVKDIAMQGGFLTDEVSPLYKA